MTVSELSYAKSEQTFGTIPDNEWRNRAVRLPICDHWAVGSCHSVTGNVPSVASGPWGLVNERSFFANSFEFLWTSRSEGPQLTDQAWCSFDATIDLNVAATEGADVLDSDVSVHP